MLFWSSWGLIQQSSPSSMPPACMWVCAFFSGLGALKRKKPHLAEKGIKPVRTAAKNTRWEVLGHPHSSPS